MNKVPKACSMNSITVNIGFFVKNPQMLNRLQIDGSFLYNICLTSAEKNDHRNLNGFFGNRISSE